MTEDLASVRYIVPDVEQAIAFHTTHLGFTLWTSALPAFADVVRRRLRLLLRRPRNAPAVGRCLTAARHGPADGTAST